MGREKSFYGFKRSGSDGDFRPDFDELFVPGNLVDDSRLSIVDRHRLEQRDNSEW